MKVKALLVIIFLAGLAGALHAQDTNMPVMSQHAYDSTLKALKLQQATKMAKDDSIKAAHAADSLAKVAALNKTRDSLRASDSAKAALMWKQDSLLQVKHLTEETKKRDSAIKHDSAAMAKAAADTAKKHKIKYAPTGYYALWFGEGYPKGDFLSKGYPRKGSDFSFTAVFPGVVSRFGIVFKIDYGRNGFNNVRYQDSLTAHSPTPYLAYSMNQSYTYTYENILAGLDYTYPMRKFSVDLRLMCGIMMATVPGVAVNITDYGNASNQLFITSYDASGRAFAFDEGLTVRYLATPGISVMLNMDNYAAAPSFTVVSNGIDQNYYGTTVETPTKQGVIIQSFHVFSVGIGVGYTIRPKLHK